MYDHNQKKTNNYIIYLKDILILRIKFQVLNHNGLYIFSFGVVKFCNIEHEFSWTVSERAPLNGLKTKILESCFK